jgi:transcriptional regulator with XRE-family HTH domain
VKPVYVSARGETPRIGARLRATRLRQGLTMENVAEAANVTKGFISRLERDETSPSVATLITICDVLSLPVGQLFEAAETDFVARADAPPIRLTGHGVDEHLLTPRGQGRLQMIRSRVEPGGAGGEELYALNCEVEVCHVLKGRVEIVFSKERFRLTAGDTLTFAGREPHTWLNPDPARMAEVIWVLVPSSWAAGT